MSIPDSSITPQILKAAEIEFLEKGFVNASLRDICQKAGVTTGALYKRFVGKDRLFYAVLKPTLDDINRFIKEVEGKDYKHLEENRTKLIWEMSEDTLKKITNFIYDRYSGFKLLLCKSEGSEYSNFLHEFVADQTKRSIAFTNAAEKNGLICQIDELELHMLLTAFWTVLFEPILHDLPREDALKRCSTVTKFFNWKEVFGF